MATIHTPAGTATDTLPPVFVVGTVESDTRPGVKHVITGCSANGRDYNCGCSCEDYRYRHRVCKHLNALMAEGLTLPGLALTAEGFVALTVRLGRPMP